MTIMKRESTRVMRINLPQQGRDGFRRSGPIATIVLFLTLCANLSAQEPITYAELVEQLEPYFAAELIGDVQLALPKGAFQVWGFGVGDYSSDGYNDLVVSIRMGSDRDNKMRIYYFVDIEGMLELVRQEAAHFVELPIEVGVTVGDGNAYLLYKRKDKGWEIYGRRFEDGVIMLVDKFTVETNTALIHEQSRNFQMLEGYDRFLRVRDEQEVFRTDFLTIPSYRRGRHVSAGYAQTATANASGYIVKGAYYRSAESDAGLNVRSAWDADYLYYNIMVDDEEIVPYADGDETIGDRVEIWIDTYLFGDRLTTGSRRQDFRMESDTNIYGLQIDLGDFADKVPAVSVTTTNVFDDEQNRATRKVKAIAARRDGGWSLKVRIPYELFGMTEPPIDPERLVEIGSTVIAHDLDNPWRPVEVTTLATSFNFDSEKPATFGALVLVPSALHYGEAENIYLPQVKERLDEVGF